MKGWGCIPILTKKGIPMRTVLRALTSSGTYVLLGVIVALTRVTASIGARGPGGGSSTQLAPILRAQEDATDVGTTVSGTTEINSLPIEVPVDGVLLISGTAYVNSYEESAIDYILNPKIDGSEATPYGWGAFQNAGVGNPMGNGDPGSRFTLSYTLSQTIGAGSHTGSQASVISAPAAAARDELSPTGQKR